jgi:hypothetical protein
MLQLRSECENQYKYSSLFLEAKGEERGGWMRGEYLWTIVNPDDRV